MFDHVMEHFENQADLAKQLGVSRPAVTIWKGLDSFPPMQCIAIERLTNGKIKASDLILHYYGLTDVFKNRK